MSFIKWESNDHPNANNSRYLGIAQIILLFVGLFFPKWGSAPAAYNASFWITEAALGVATYYTAIKVGFQNTFQTNDDFKTGEQVVSAFANIVAPLLFMAAAKDLIK